MTGRQSLVGVGGSNPSASTNTQAPSRVPFAFLGPRRAQIDSYCGEDGSTLLWHCNRNVIATPCIVWMSMADTLSYTVTLPRPAVRLIMALIPKGLHGPTRAEVTATLVLDQLKILVAQGLKEGDDEADVGAAES